MELFIACLKAFLVGGAVCCLAELLIDKTGLTPARILTLCVVLGAALGALGLYGPFAEWAGAGATVPLPGFGNLLARGVREAVAEHGLLGALTGGLSAAAAGITAAMCAGVSRLWNKNWPSWKSAGAKTAAPASGQAPRW